MLRSTQSSESDSTGWISITDTYLLFIALLLTLAMAIATTNRQQQIDKDAAISELKDANSTVTRLSSRARVLQDEIDDLKSSLADAEQEVRNQRNLVSQTTSRLTMAQSRLEDLERKYRSLADASEDAERMADVIFALEQKRDELQAKARMTEALTEQIATLERERDQLRSDSAMFEVQAEQIAALEQERDQLRSQADMVEGLTEQIVALEKERDQLRSESAMIENLADQIATLEKERDQLRSEAEMNEGLAEQIVALRNERDELQLQTAVIESQTEEIRALEKERDELRAQVALVKDLTDQIAALELNASRTAEEQNRQNQEQGRIRSQLLGLDGSLGNVVFLLDRSQTMGESGRWDEAVQTVTKWIEHLPIENAAVVMFSGNSLESIPARGYATRSGDELTQMTSQLNGVNTGGNTNTFEAIEAAFRYDDLDTIILFTDGRPDGRYGPNEVLDLVESERERRLAEHGLDIKLHVVGVGDYFDEPMKRFLLGLREAGEGKFIGQ